MARKANTGGLLNLLNGKMGISAPYKSVPVIKLINTHKPKSYDELEALIEYHHLNDCSCGIKSQGSVYDFGKNLYDAQIQYWGEHKFTLEECVQWEYDLFIIKILFVYFLFASTHLRALTNASIHGVISSFHLSVG